MVELLSEVEGRPMPPNIPSLWGFFGEAIKTYPDNLALICIHQEPSLYGIPSTPLEDGQYHQKPYLRWTFRNLKQGVDRAVAGLEKLGAKKGVRVFTFLPNMAEYILTAWAVFRLGAVFVPINPRNLLNKEEVVHMIHTAAEGADSSPLVVIVDSNDVAQQFTNLGLDLKYQMVVCASDPLKDSWLPFSQLMALVKEASHEDGLVQSNDDMIFFTSGTTSFPKGVHWKHPGMSQIIEQRKDRTAMGPEDNNCTVFPNNHAIGFIFSITPLALGATVVYPGPAFAPNILMDVIMRENCTYTQLAPTMVHALVSVMKPDTPRLKKLKGIMLGGSLVTPEVLRQCLEDLGCKGVENGWGMTEGAVSTSGTCEDRFDIIRNDLATIGKVMPGSKARVCAPGTKNVVPRGEVGEFHFSGPLLQDGYIGLESEDFYADDAGRRWFNTGDQATISADGLITILGRYKEMIIRGGENISPAAIEFALSKVPELVACNVQIVGAADEIAGQLPVAIIQGELTPDVVKKIQGTVLSNLGPIYVPDDVLPLKVLGLDQYPKTMAGKIQKTKLANLVAVYRGAQQSSKPNGVDGPKKLEDSIRNIWSRAVGHDVEDDMPISNFADSITVMRVRDRIVKETGSSISLSEMVDAVNIAGQIKLLENQPLKPRKKVIRTPRPGPLEMEDIIHIGEDPDLFNKTKAYIATQLSSHDLSWDDVEDVLPAYDFGRRLSLSGVFNSWNLKFALLTKGLNPVQVRVAIEKTLSNNRVVPSFILWDDAHLGPDTVLHVLIRPQKKLFDQVIFDYGKVKTFDELKQMPLKYPFKARAVVPGPLVRLFIVEVEELKSAAVVLDVHHSIMDASHGQLFMEDFDQALGGTTLIEHVDYKTWADSYFSLRDSREAKLATKWHVNRLKGLDKHTNAIFPPAGRKPVQMEEDSLHHSFRAPAIPSLRHKHPHLTAPIILKTAWALLNIHLTGHTHALFANLEAARTRFPFIPKALESLDGQAYEASDVAGPTIQEVTNLVEFKPEETALAFLDRMQDDQNNLTKYASAPLDEVIASLGAAAGPLVIETLKAQIFNWVPGMGSTGTNPFAHFEMVNFVAHPEIRLAVNAGMGGQSVDTVFMQLRGSVFTMEEFKGFAEDLAKITCWVTENLEVPVGRFREGLEVVNGVH